MSRHVYEKSCRKPELPEWSDIVVFIPAAQKRLKESDKKISRRSLADEIALLIKRSGTKFQCSGPYVERFLKKHNIAVGTSESPDE